MHEGRFEDCGEGMGSHFVVKVGGWKGETVMTCSLILRGAGFLSGKAGKSDERSKPITETDKPPSPSLIAPVERWR